MTKLKIVNLHLIEQLTRVADMGYAFSPSIETAGGILCCWDSSLFRHL